ncbi:MAG: DUF87 domain-containing protein [Candidatus Heimdallarchaeota archaeon]|nr:DUF87 domain-containing protein [Candidatus Heimdallarchaeota archaeon]MDH5647228.1 DUF87 domain-containing protein [Candidatus Heimdallarchaeota archaeon]
MNLVDEIEYLSDKGYHYMDVKDYNSARHYFLDAANKAHYLSKMGDGPHNIKLKEIATKFLDLAKNAHNKDFEEIKHVQSSTFIPPKVNTDKNLNKKEPKTMKIPLGISYETNKTVYWQPNLLMNGIVTVTGGSGSGKTETLKSLANLLIDRKLPCIIFDLHGDIELDIPKISLDYQGKYGINPMELFSKSPLNGGPIPHINNLMTQLSYAMKDKFSPSQNSWLRSLLKFSYEEFGIYQNDPTTWENQPPDFEYLLNLMKYPDEKIINSKKIDYIRVLESINNSTKMAVETRLSPILEHPAFLGEEKIPIKDMLEKPMRIMLKPLNTVEMQFLAADTLMRQIFAYIKSMGHILPDASDKFRLFILIDEVKILTGYRGKVNDPYHILNRFATEARKFGLGLILASQVFGHFGKDIRSNSATKIILRTMDLEETKKCAKELKIDMDKLSSIKKPGEGYLITSKEPTAKYIQIVTYQKIK